MTAQPKGLTDENVASARPRWTPFLREFLASPRSVASIAPSGKSLGKLMAASLPADTKRVVEIGAGTGAITEALIQHGIASHNLFIVEMNPVLHDILVARYPGANVTCGDARDLVGLTSTWRENRTAVDAVCSSLGMLAIPHEARQAIVAAAFDIIRPGGRFVQYTYGRRCPIGAYIREQLDLDYSSAGFTWLNLPPARVFVYQQRSSGL